MEEKLKYDQEHQSEENIGSKWKMDINSVSMLMSSTSVVSTANDHILKYFPEKKERSYRPVIPATTLERLAYFGCCTSSPSKTQIICMQHTNFNRFLWHYIFNVFFKSLPHTYIYTFLASYAPNDHFFISKMLPICYGFNIAYILASIIDLTLYTETVLKLLDYSINGLLFKNPWNRCGEFDKVGNISIICYKLDDFAKKFQNGTATFNSTYYVSSDGELFQIAPIEYYWKRNNLMLNFSADFGSNETLFFIMLWVIVGLHGYQLNKRYIWKTLYRIQVLVGVIYVLVFMHLSVDLLLAQLDNKVELVVDHDMITKILWKADIDLLAESMTTPPGIHILTSRSLQEIRPSRDSALIIASNALYYIFKGFLSYLVRKYCETIINAPLYVSDFNQDSFFFLWPIYFSTFYLGNFYSLIFFILHFLLELFTLIITFNCLIEAIVCEWKQVHRVLVIIIVCVLGFLWFDITSKNRRAFFYIYTTGMVTLMEVIALYVIYPCDRLIDDINFYTGVYSTKMRIYNLRLVPIFYTVKITSMFFALFEVVHVKNDADINICFWWSIVIVFLPIVFGMIVSAFYWINIQKKSWTSLFRPRNDWGPEYLVRQLRKQYDSKEFVGSQAPRTLSRYMITKAESEVYQVDIPYDMISHRSTVVRNTANNSPVDSN